VHVLCDPTRLGALRDVLISETGTLGVRAARLDRWPQARHTITVDIDGHAVRPRQRDVVLEPRGLLRCPREHQRATGQ